MRKTSILAAVLVSLALFAVPSKAWALGPVGVEVAVKAGYGANPGPSDPNPLGFGLGGRAGVSFMGVYGGVNILYYFGGSSSQDLLGVATKFSANSLLYGIEAGYGLTLVDILTLRAHLGLGNFQETASGSGSAGSLTVSGGSQTLNNLYLEPGVTGLLGFGLYFVGVDANLLVLPGIKDSNGNSSTESSLTIHGQVGVKF